jgi:ferric-dicitrate binding protein FerR (iron transport regulator)
MKLPGVVGERPVVLITDHAWPDVDTERAVASIKGTQFKVEATKDTTTLTVSEGIVAFKDKVSGKETDVLAFQQAVAGPQGIVGPTQTNTLSDPNFGDGKIQMFETQGN